MKKYVLAIVAMAVVFLTGCDHAPANVKTLQTTDCGIHWNIIPAGQRIPGTVGKCSYNTVLPDYPMQGDLEFKAQFTGNVLVTAKVTYDYEIFDPILFLGEAKFLGKQSATAEDAAKGSNMAGIESAENQVIDVRLREAATSRTIKLNIVDFNPANFEDELQKGTNNDLAARGVRILSMSLVIIPEEQTRQAIDAATAMNVYQSKGLTALGERLAVARAGATKISIDTK